MKYTLMIQLITPDYHKTLYNTKNKVHTLEEVKCILEGTLGIKSNIKKICEHICDNIGQSLYIQGPNGTFKASVGIFKVFEGDK